MIEFKFPDVGEGITEGEIVKWRVKEGDTVKEHDVIAEIETDKAIVEIPSPAAGTILKLHHREGDTVKVGETLATIGEAGEKVSEELKPGPAEVEQKQAEQKAGAVSAAIPRKSTSVVGEIPEEETIVTREAEPEKTSPPSAEPAESAAILATPAVRRLAKDLHVNLAMVKGSGLAGRITEEDVRMAAQQRGVTEPTPAAKISRKYDLYGYVERVPLKGVRKAIAQHMIQSAYTAPHVTHMDEADVTELVKIREKEKLRLEKEGVHLTYLPFIIKAVIHALKEHPYVNASLDDEHEEIILKKYYNIGVAVDTPDGLIVPAIKEADGKSIIDMAKEIGVLAEKAQQRRLDLADLKGGTFTITNIGVIGGLHATPIINYPEAAILATGKIREELKLNEMGRLEARKILPLSLAFDHRIFDGAEAARFANRVKEHLENPSELLVDRD